MAAKTKAEEYREHAEEAERQAEKAHDSNAKVTWQTVAGHWREMSKQAERNGW
jgi:hypothetical protein